MIFNRSEEGRIFYFLRNTQHSNITELATGALADYQAIQSILKRSNEIYDNYTSSGTFFDYFKSNKPFYTHEIALALLATKTCLNILKIKKNSTLRKISNTIEETLQIASFATMAVSASLKTISIQQSIGYFLALGVYHLQKDNTSFSLNNIIKIKETVTENPMLLKLIREIFPNI